MTKPKSKKWTPPKYDKQKQLEVAAAKKAEARIINGLDEITDSTPFTPKLTIKEFCVKLEFCGFVITRVEKMIGIGNGSIRTRMKREPWATYFAEKYPDKFGKTSLKGHGRSNWLKTSLIPCMVEGCTNTVRVTHEADKGIPRGMRKRCPKCRNTELY